MFTLDPSKYPCATVLGVIGRLVVLSYHSLEDRIVKNFFKSKTLGDNNSTTRRFKILTPKPLQPSFEEIERNSRSRSAKLRVAELVF